MKNKTLIEQNIPKVIHYIWFGKPMPWNIKDHIRMVKNKYKEFKIKIWTEKDFDPSTVKYTKLAFQKKKWAFISDYLRVKILYEHGGIYLDTDMVPHGDMRPIINGETLVLGFEYSKMVTTGFCASVKGHPLMKKLLNVYEAFDYMAEDDIKFIINNELWTYYLEKIYGLKTNNQPQRLLGGITIFPMSYFAEFKPKETSVFLHHHTLSWTSKRKAKAMNFFLKNLIRPTQNWIRVLLELQKKMYFRKNSKILKKNKKQIEKVHEDDNK